MGLGMSPPRRGDVYLVALGPTQGQEIEKMRPCAIVSPNELNNHLSTFMVAPMTTGGHAYPFRIPCSPSAWHQAKPIRYPRLDRCPIPSPKPQPHGHAKRDGGEDHHQDSSHLEQLSAHS